MISRDTQLEQRYENDGLQLVGHLHTHGCYVDQSPEDERCWKGLARELGRPIVGLIVGGSTPDSPFPLAAPLFAAWMAGPNRIRRISITKETVAPLWF